MNSYLKRRDDIKSCNLDSLSNRRLPSSRDRYSEPTRTPKSERGSRHRDDDLEPVVERLLGERRRRGDPLPPPPNVPPRPSPSSAATAPTAKTTTKDPQTEAQQRVAAERARTAALLASKRKAMSSSASSVASTPRSEYGAQEGGFGMFNRDEVKEARRERANAGWGERRDRRGERERESREARGRRR